MPKLDYSIDIHFPADRDNDDYDLYEIQGKQFRGMVKVVVRDTRGNRDVTIEYSVGANKNKFILTGFKMTRLSIRWKSGHFEISI